MPTQITNDAQQRFDTKYITSSEVMSSLGVSRTAVLEARRTGRLPDPIYIQGQIYLWERDSVKDYLAAWKVILDVRRGAGA